MEKRIYFHDTDSGGVVYYANYLKYLEEARTEFLEKRGWSVAELHEKGFFYAVRSCNIIYRSPARYGDTILCDAVLKTLTAAQMIFSQKVVEAKTGRLIVEAEVALVSLDKNFRPIAIPEELRAALA